MSKAMEKIKGHTRAPEEIEEPALYEESQHQDPRIQPTLNLMQEVKNQMHSKFSAQGRTKTAKSKVEKENFGISEKSTESKTKWSNHIAWGKRYGCLSADGKVLRLTWKDSQIVLFMTTISEARTAISRMRKRPNSKDKWIKQAFEDRPFKQLEILDFFDMYNHLMNSVDRADQIRSYYCSNGRNYRTWQPLWDYLFQTTIYNAALIWIDQRHSTKRREGI
jgi:hypothetical protein